MISHDCARSNAYIGLKCASRVQPSVVTGAHTHLHLFSPLSCPYVCTCSRTVYMHARLLHLASPQLQQLVERVRLSFHDPVRASKLLTSRVQQDVHVLVRHSPSGANMAADQGAAGMRQQGLSCPEEEALGIALYNRHPGRPSYAIFIANASAQQPTTALAGHGDGSDTHSSHSFELSLLCAMLDGIMAMPDPGRLAFSCIPAWAAPALTRHMTERYGATLLYDEPCVKLVSSRRSGEWRAAMPAVAEGYELDLQLHACDLDSVDATWAYRSECSRALLESLAQHNLVCCARPAGSLGSGGGGASGASSAAPGSSAPAVAWALQYHDGSMGVAYTLPQHRRRGLMRAVISTLQDAILASGQAESFS